MSASKQFKQMATEFANALHERAMAVEMELEKVELQAAALKAQLHESDLTQKRLANFPIKVGADYLCPRCWVTSGKPSPLTPIPSDTKDDLFRCHSCHFEPLISN